MGAFDVTHVRLGSNAVNPPAVPFTLNPTDPNVLGMPPPPTQQWAAAGNADRIQPGHNALDRQHSDQAHADEPDVFSEAYVQVDASTYAISQVVSTGLWPSDKPSRPTLLMNYSGGFSDATVNAGLGALVQCVSATAGDFDNDTDIDLYLACRTGASNLPNILYQNQGGTFVKLDGAGGAVGPVGMAVSSGAGTADSVVSGDYDVDGFLDLFVTNGFNLRPLQFGGPNKLFHNQGNGNNWVELDLVGTNSDRDAVGAHVYATAAGKTQFRVPGRRPSPLVAGCQASAFRTRGRDQREPEREVAERCHADLHGRGRQPSLSDYGRHQTQCL